LLNKNNKIQNNLMINSLKLAAWSGVAIFILYIFSSFFNSALGFGFWNYIFIILSSAAGMIFAYGFFVLGKKYKQGLVKGFSIYFIVIGVILMILILLLMPRLQGFVSSVENFQGLETQMQTLSEKYGGEDNIPQEEIDKLTEPYADITLIFLKWFLIGYGLLVIFYGIPRIFYGIGLLKLQKQVELSKAAGILNIIGGATMIVFVGGILMGIAFILEMIILFKESAKFESKRH
jgi:hypothetical protein